MLNAYTQFIIQHIVTICTRKERNCTGVLKFMKYFMIKNYSIKIRSILLLILLSCCFFLLQCSSDHSHNTDKTEKTPVKSKTNVHFIYSQENPGIWFKRPTPQKNHDVSTLKQKTDLNFKRLQSLSYLSGYKVSPSLTSVTSFDRDLSYNGANLIISGHKPYAAIMDMMGKILHTWAFNYSDLDISTKEIILRKNLEENFKNYWRRVHLFENGDLLAIYDYQCLIKLDKNSKLLWICPIRTHHDLLVTKEGNIWVLIAEKKLIADFSTKLPVLEDSLCLLNSEGKEIKKVSLIKCFKSSNYFYYLKNYSSLLKRENVETGDYVTRDVFHTNTITMLDGTLSDKHPAFKKGNILISIRRMNLLVIIDIEKESIVWAIEGNGIWKYPHEPQLLKNGNMLLFDNLGAGNSSRILEFNPLAPEEIIWSYTGSPPESFYCELAGSQQRLPNGNTLITDTVSGRAFEVTHEDRKIVWEYINTKRAGENNELIAALFDVVRLEKNFPLSWANKSKAVVDINP